MEWMNRALQHVMQDMELFGMERPTIVVYRLHVKPILDH